jgi:predicted protein tyrosine phosphatase
MGSDRQIEKLEAASPTRILFVCTQNRARSLTAETLYHRFPSYEVLSAGTDRSARIPVTEEHVAWADLIFVMQEEHTQFIRDQFHGVLDGKEVICLNIPDVYNYMEPVLVAVLRSSLKPYLRWPSKPGRG